MQHARIEQELPVRANILHGVLGADLIAFNHFDYVRHFQNACTRILGLESYPTFEAERHYSFEYDGRLISLEICPAGIDPNKFALIFPLSRPNDSGRLRGGTAETGGRRDVLLVGDEARVRAPRLTRRR